MKKWITGIGISLALGIFATPVFGAEIENIAMTPPASSIDLDIELSWKALPAENMANVEGYALQWSTNQTDIRIDKAYRVLMEGTGTVRSMRAADFERDEIYYFRVYTYTKDGRETVLGNGSKILKWEWPTVGDVESELLEPNDPVIVNNSSTDDAAYDFGELRIVKYDKSAQFFWSSPTSITSKEFDGFKITLSKNTDLSDPVGEVDAGESFTKAYVTGLEPATKYYAAGYFYKTEAGDDKKFGRSAIKTFTTEKEFTSEQEARFQRTLTRLKQYGLGATLDLDGDSDDESDDSSTSSSSSSSSSSSTSSASSSASDYTTISEMEARLEEIKQQIFALFAERLILQRNLAREQRLAERD